MRPIYLIALGASLTLLLGVQWYQSSAAICPVPLSYTLGDIDTSFGITREYAQARVTAAEMLWEEETGRELFVYEAEAPFTINFIYDERQETVNSEVTTRTALDRQQAENRSMIELVEALQVEYDELSAAYDDRVAAYEQRLTAYNQKVNRYNDRGGAPEDVFAELEEERAVLTQQSAALNRTASELNDLAVQISALGEEGNQRIEQYNRDVARYNEEYGYAREFTQGDYQGDAINIYTFTSDTELETVLAHEFGHALGIGHVEDSEALMYYLLEEPDEPPRITDADLAVFEAVCGESETMGQRIRHWIRTALQSIF